MRLLALGSKVTAPYCNIFPDRIVLRSDPAFLPKVVSDFHRSQDIVILTLPGRTAERDTSPIDVRNCFLAYIKRTTVFEGNKPRESF